MSHPDALQQPHQWLRGVRILEWLLLHTYHQYEIQLEHDAFSQVHKQADTHHQMHNMDNTLNKSSPQHILFLLVKHLAFQLILSKSEKGLSRYKCPLFVVDSANSAPLNRERNGREKHR